jgi:hypothetical protein
MDRRILIIPGVILFFVIVGILAWFGDNPACALILEILGGLFLFCAFCVFPGVMLARIFHHKKAYILIGGVFIFWCVALTVLGVFKPGWGWAFVKWSDRYLLKFISLLSPLI